MDCVALVSANFVSSSVLLKSGSVFY